ncbi:unnamed protein product, partial [Mycena citricolor]
CQQGPPLLISSTLRHRGFFDVNARGSSGVPGTYHRVQWKIEVARHSLSVRFFTAGRQISVPRTYLHTAAETLSSKRVS